MNSQLFLAQFHLCRTSSQPEIYTPNWEASLPNAELLSSDVEMVAPSWDGNRNSWEMFNADWEKAFPTGAIELPDGDCTGIRELGQYRLFYQQLSENPFFQVTSSYRSI